MRNIFKKSKKKTLDFSNVRANDRVAKRVCELVGELADIKPWNINMNMDLRYNLDLSSLDVVEIIMTLEKEFDIFLSNEEIYYCKKVGNLVNVVSSKVFPD